MVFGDSVRLRRIEVAADMGAVYGTIRTNPDDPPTATPQQMFEIDLTGGVTYYIYTVVGTSEGHIDDTSLKLLDSDGTTVLASNDNSRSGNHGSYLEYTPDSDVHDATILVLAGHRTDRGSYRLYITTTQPDLTAPPPAPPPEPPAPPAEAIVCTADTSLPANTGVVTETNLDLSNGAFDVTAVCADGYVGSLTATACTASGEYTISGSCAQPICTTATVLPANIGAVTETNVDLGNGAFDVSAVCADGYEGTLTATACTSNSEYTVSGSCTPIVCTADTSLPPNTGTVTETNLDLSNGAFDVTAVCDEGYEGSLTATACESSLGGGRNNNGEYTISGTCTPIVCTADTSLPANTGIVTETNVDLSNGALDVTVACADGYEGPLSVTACTVSGEYTVSGSCTPIVCTADTSLPSNTGTVTETNLDLSNGDFDVTAICGEGYEGSLTATSCTASGEYTLSGSCTPIICTADTTPPSNTGTVTETNTDLSNGAFDVTAVCADGYGGSLTVTACTTSGHYTVTGSCVAIVAAPLFFAEAAEGNSHNKYLEIFNPTDAAVDLSAYAFPNAANSVDVPGEYEYWNTFAEGAIIAAGGLYTICHPSASDTIQEFCDQQFNYLSNGDDGFCIVFGSESDYQILDCVGDWLGDPGQGFDVCNAGITKDSTIVRNCGVTSGNGGDWASSASAENCEWAIYDQNEWAYGGFHDPHCITPAPPPMCGDSLDEPCSEPPSSNSYFENEHACGAFIGMDYGGNPSYISEDGEEVFCGYAPIVAIYADHADWPAPGWYSGDLIIDATMDSPLECQARCFNNAECNYFSYEWELTDGGMYHECYMKTSYEDANCMVDPYVPLGSENEEWHGESGPSLECGSPLELERACGAYIGMDYGGNPSYFDSNGEEVSCGYAPIVAIYADHADWPAPSWYSGDLIVDGESSLTMCPAVCCSAAELTVRCKIQM
eukprot:SAG11_NODE_435_length_9493_cov_21.529806_2_plen_952_part_00